MVSKIGKSYGEEMISQCGGADLGEVQVQVPPGVLHYNLNRVGHRIYLINFTS